MEQQNQSKHGVLVEMQNHLGKLKAINPYYRHHNLIKMLIIILIHHSWVIVMGVTSFLFRNHGNQNGLSGGIFSKVITFLIKNPLSKKGEI